MRGERAGARRRECVSVQVVRVALAVVVLAVAHGELSLLLALLRLLGAAVELKSQPMLAVLGETPLVPGLRQLFFGSALALLCRREWRERWGAAL